MAKPTGPTSLTGLMRRWLRRAWDSLTGAMWFVDCARCGIEYGAAAIDRPGSKFRHRDNADAAARAAGWHIDGERGMCPACRTVSEREEAPA